MEHGGGGDGVATAVLVLCWPPHHDTLLADDPPPPPPPQLRSGYTLTTSPTLHSSKTIKHNFKFTLHTRQCWF